MFNFLCLLLGFSLHFFSSVALIAETTSSSVRVTALLFSPGFLFLPVGSCRLNTFDKASDSVSAVVVASNEQPGA